MSKLKSIDLGESITKFNSGYTFYYGTSPKIVICRAVNPPILNNAYGQNSGIASSKICVPIQSIDIYKTTISPGTERSWTEFANNICGFANLTTGDILTQITGYTTTTWYSTQDDIINGTNGIIADGINTANTTGEWYCRVRN